MTIFSRFLTLGALLAASSASAGPIRLELNALNPQQDTCQIVFVAQNESGSDLERLVLEAVLFDRQGRVAVLTLFDLQDLPAARMRVRSFQMAGLACDGLSRLLINGISACVPEGPACEAPLVLEARVPVEVLH